MYNILIIKTNGDILEKSLKKNDEMELCKACGYKNNNGFGKIHSYNINDAHYSVYGKTNGRANTENKYEWPPPIDSCLFFGTMCIVKIEDEIWTNLSSEEWKTQYETLYGGFEDLNDDETRSEDSEIYSDDDYTKEGYLKDDFVVEDDEEELCEEAYEDDE